MTKFRKYFVDRTKSSITMDIVVSMFVLFCLVSAIIFIVDGSIRNALLAFGFMLVPIVIYVVEYILKMQISLILVIGALFLMAGSICGACYNLYSIFPAFDSILHTTSGFIFACFGFALMNYFIGDLNSTKKVVGCILMGFVFSLWVATMWELIEYAGSTITANDMQEDSYVYEFGTYLLSNDHNNMTVISNITQTVIYYGDNQVLTIDGYIDIGLFDTLNDSLVCLVGATIYLIVISISYATKKNVYRLCVPKIKDEYSIIE